MADYDLDKKTVSRWRTLLTGHPDRFVKAIERDQVKARTMMEGRSTPKDEATGYETWHTPENYVEKVREVLGNIDVDPASNAVAQETVKAGLWYGEDEDGTTQEWLGRVFCNPPYSLSKHRAFVDTLEAEYQRRWRKAESQKRKVG